MTKKYLLTKEHNIKMTITLHISKITEENNYAMMEREVTREIKEKVI